MADLWNHTRPGDANEPTLLLLHGLGATGAVFNRLLDVVEWPGPIAVPDLRGHGHSPWAPTYSGGVIAADVADLLGHDRSVVVLGHSLGGAVAMMLCAPWSGVYVQRCLTVGVKSEWSSEELERIPELAARPRRMFETEADATNWYLKLSGLFGSVEPDDAVVARHVTQTDDGWTTTQDPRTILVGPPPLAELHAVATAPIRHACGDADPIATAAQLREFDAHAVSIGGAGHNAMVDQPVVVAALLH